MSWLILLILYLLVLLICRLLHHTLSLAQITALFVAFFYFPILAFSVYSGIPSNYHINSDKTILCEIIYITHDTDTNFYTLTYKTPDDQVHLEQLIQKEIFSIEEVQSEPAYVAVSPLELNSWFFRHFFPTGRQNFSIYLPSLNIIKEVAVDLAQGIS